MSDDDPQYTVNVDVAIRRETGDAPEYLFIVRGTDEEHAPGTFGFPGGTLEATPGQAEVLAATAQREVREEVGVDIADPQLITSTVFELDGGRPCLNVVITAEYAGGETHVAEPEEVDAVEWRTPETVLRSEETPPWTRDLLDAVLDHRQG